jgi:aryl-alcohol dehydrogenase-like predicted oxidoreductase
MKYRTLGRTGIKASEIGLGSWELGGSYFLRDRSSANNDPAGYADVAEAEAVATIHFGLDHGLTFIDTAPIYGDGESERRVARALRGRPERAQGQVTVETKLGVYAEEGRYRRVFTREVVRREFARSQERLQTDVIDVDLLHSPTREEFGNGESLRALLELKEAGKVCWIGLSSSYDVAHTKEILATGQIDVLQIPLSLMRPEWQDVLGLCRKHNVGVVVREPLFNGYLTGRLTEDTQFSPDDQRSVWGREKHLANVRLAREFAFLTNDQRRPAQAALKWILSFPEITTVIAGSSNRDELAENLAVSDQPDLTADELRGVARVHDRHFAVRA